MEILLHDGEEIGPQSHSVMDQMQCLQLSDEPGAKVLSHTTGHGLQASGEGSCGQKSLRGTRARPRQVQVAGSCPRGGSPAVSTCVVRLSRGRPARPRHPRLSRAGRRSCSWCGPASSAWWSLQCGLISAHPLSSLFLSDL